MSRASAIGAVVVASGILVGGSIISVYAINSSVIAEDSPHAVIQTAALVAPPSAAPATSEAATGPTIGPEDLTVTSSDDELIVPVVPSPMPAQTGANRAATPTTITASTRQRTGGAAAAQRTVSRATGGRLLATWATQHSGVAVYAVKVQRGDGSVVVGYVDRSNGTVVDWARVQTTAGKPARTTTSSSTATRSPSPRPSRHSSSARPSTTATLEPDSFGQDDFESRQPSEQPSWVRETPQPVETHDVEQSDD